MNEIETIRMRVKMKKELDEYLKKTLKKNKLYIKEGGCLKNSSKAKKTEY